MNGFLCRQTQKGGRREIEDIKVQTNGRRAETAELENNLNKSLLDLYLLF